MKASNGIALVPQLDTLSLTAIVDMTVGCVRRLNPGRTIVVHPFPTALCPQMISDKLWMVENLLSLLSNACKVLGAGRRNPSIVYHQ